MTTRGKDWADRVLADHFSTKSPKKNRIDPLERATHNIFSLTNTWPSILIAPSVKCTLKKHYPSNCRPIPHMEKRIYTHPPALVYPIYEKGARPYKEAKPRLFYGRAYFPPTSYTFSISSFPMRPEEGKKEKKKKNGLKWRT